MAFELVTEDCESVRKAIDIRLDDIILPNSTILLPIYKDTAIDYIASRFDDDTVPEDVESKAKLALIFYCASLICPAIKQVQSEKIAGAERSYKSFDGMAKAKELESRAEGIVNQILTSLEPSQSNIGFLPKMFALAKARR